MEYNTATDSFSNSNSFSSSNHVEEGSSNIRAEVGRAGFETIIRDGRMEVVKDPSGSFEASTDFARSGDILSTATNPTGSPVVGRSIRDTDLVTYQGQQVPVALAKTFGWLETSPTVAPDGSMTAALKGTEEGNAGSVIEEQEGGIELSDGSKLTEQSASEFEADEHTEELLALMVESTGPDTQIAALNSYVFGGGEVDDRVINRLAEQSGREPHEVRTDLQEVEQGMTAAVMGQLSKAGVHNEDAFAEFIQADPHRMRAAQEAAQNLMMHNSTAGFEALASNYMEQIAYHEPESVIDALNDVGWDWHYSDEGTLMVETPRGEFSFEQGVKAGVIRFL